MSLNNAQKENLKTLIDALNLGEYEQAWCALREGNCYCIGGVMCDMSNMGEWESATGGRYSFVVRESSYCCPDCTSYLPPKDVYTVPSQVQEFYGVTKDVASVLMEANDLLAPFNVIATALEWYVEDDGEGKKWAKAVRPYLRKITKERLQI